MIARLFICLALWAGTATAAEPLKVIAAENFYGDIAAQIGGKLVTVESVLTNPDQDPHLFEASPSLSKGLAAADLIIVNGAGYDTWMSKLAAGRAAATLDIAKLAKTPDGANPHLWYDVETVEKAASAIAAALAAKDPNNAAAYGQNLAVFKAEVIALKIQIATLRQQFNAAPVTATEPVFGYMAKALGLTMRNEPFQLAIMNNAEPSVSQVKAFEQDLTGHLVKLLLYNAQASSPAVKRLKKIAQDNHIAVVGITETAPANTHYQDWMSAQLAAIQAALKP